MKFIPLALTILFTLSLSFTTHSQEIRGSKPLKKSTTIQQGKNWILAIGINRYENWQDLRNAKNDARSIVKILQENYGFDNIIDTLYDENATAAEIKNAINKADEHLSPKDRLVVFFAGHGTSRDKIIGNKNLSEGYLVPTNGEFETNTNPLRWIEIEEFIEDIVELKAHHICMFLDACNSGYAVLEPRLRGSNINYYDLENIISRKVFTSSAADEVASDGDEITGNSVFTEQLINALKFGVADQDNDSRISTLELNNYLERQMLRKGIDQTFKYGNLKLDDGGMMFFNISEEKIIDFEERRNIKEEKYTAIAFEAGIPGPSRLNRLETYIPASIIDALVEFPNKNYNVEEVNIFSDSNAFGINTPYEEYFKDKNVTRYFDGRYIEIGKDLTIQIFLRDGSNHNIIYKFPDISGSSNPDSIKSIVNKVKRRVKGFLGMDEDILLKYTNAPDFNAYEYLQESYDVSCKDITKARELVNKAIRIDSNYFKAYLWKIWLNKKCPGYVDRQNAIDELLDLEKKIDRFNLSEYEKSRMKIFKKEILSKYDDVSKFYFSNALRQNEYKYFEQSFWWSINSNYLSLAKNSIDRAEKLDNFKDKADILRLWRSIYQVHVQEVSPRLKSDFDSLGLTGFARKFKRFNYYMFCRLLLENDPDILYNKLNDLRVENPRYYKLVGNLLNRNGDNEGATKFFNKGLEICNDTLDSHVYYKITFFFKLREYRKIVEEFKKYGFDFFFKRQDYSSIIYYLIGSNKLNKKADSEYFVSMLLNDQRFPGFAYYTLAKYELSLNEKESALTLLKKAYNTNFSFGMERYAFDPDLKPLFDHPEFIEFVKPK